MLYLIAGTDDLVADGGIGLPQLAARRSAVLWHALPAAPPWTGRRPYLRWAGGLGKGVKGWWAARDAE